MPMVIHDTFVIWYSTSWFVCLEYGSNLYYYKRLVALEYFLTVPSLRND